MCWVTPRSGHAQYTLKHRTAVELVSGSVDKSVIVWVKGKDDTVRDTILRVYTHQPDDRERFS